QLGCMMLEAFSASHGKAGAYLPVLDLLHTDFKITSDDDARCRQRARESSQYLIGRSKKPCRICSRCWESSKVRMCSRRWTRRSQIKKRRTLDAIKGIVLSESLNQPLLVIFEDLHLIDQETQEFLNLLADSLANAKILLLVNYRPEYSH